MKSIVLVIQNLLKPYIDNKDKAYAGNIAPIEVSPAGAAHSIGTQLIYEGKLYDVTAPIDIGDTLTVGTNITAADDVETQIASAKNSIINLGNTKADKAAIDTEYETIGSAALYSHISGTVFYGANGNLYKATADIAVGDTLTVNTNCVLDNVVGVVNDLKSDKEDAPVILTQTLTAGATTLTFTNAAIGNNSRIKYLSDPFVMGLITDAVQSGTSVTLTCAEQANNVSVMLEVYN